MERVTNEYVQTQVEETNETNIRNEYNKTIRQWDTVGHVLRRDEELHHTVVKGAKTARKTKKFARNISTEKIRLKISLLKRS